MRIIHNTTFIVEEAIEQEWVEYMRQQYLPALRLSPLCEDVIFTKVSIDQAEGKNYSVQLIFGNEEQQKHFVENNLPPLEAKIIQKYANHCLCFSSLLTEI